MAMGIYSRIIPQVFKFSYLSVLLIRRVRRLDTSSIEFKTIATIMNLRPIIVGIKVSPK